MIPCRCLSQYYSFPGYIFILRIISNGKHKVVFRGEDGLLRPRKSLYLGPCASVED